MRREAVLGVCGVVVLLLVAAGSARLAGRLGGPPPRATASASPITLLETGSSLIYPAMERWGSAYGRAHPGVRLTVQATGSGAGIADSESGTAAIGTSDVYLPSGAFRALRNIPLCVSGQVVVYRLPGVGTRALRLSGPVLAAIYQGRVRNWNAPSIRALNPGLRLPDHAIVPVRRLDASGDTWLFSTYLAVTSDAWRSGLGTAASGVTVPWPKVVSEVAVFGNSGVLQAVLANPYALGYLGVSYSARASAAGLGVALLRNAAGRFLAPTPKALRAAARAAAARMSKDQAASAVDMPGADAYPLANFEYAIVRRDIGDRARAAAVRAFLDWCLTEGSQPAYLLPYGLVSLPEGVARASRAQVAALGS